MNTTTRAAFANVADADVFAAHKVPAFDPCRCSKQDWAARMAIVDQTLIACSFSDKGRERATADFARDLHVAMGWRADHDTSGLTF